MLSGFLITGLILRERAQTGVIRLPRFFFRRFMRIAPPALVYLAVVVGLYCAGLSDAGPTAWLHTITYTSNYVDMPWDLSHTWSLSVEEQFYLFWPVVLAVSGLAGGRRAVVFWLIASPIFRAVASASPDWPYFYLFGFEANADALAAGCAVALLRDAAWERPRWRAFLTSPLFWPGVFCLALCWPLSAQMAARDVWGISVANLAVALVLERCLRVPTETMTRFLDWAWLRRLGSLSYALYLCQQPFMTAGRDLSLAVRFLAIGVSAWLLHWSVEGPALRLRQRLERRFFVADAPRP